MRLIHAFLNVITKQRPIRLSGESDSAAHLWSPAFTNIALPQWGSQLDGRMTLLPSNQTAVCVLACVCVRTHTFFSFPSSAGLDWKAGKQITLLMEFGIFCGSLKESLDSFKICFSLFCFSFVYLLLITQKYQNLPELNIYKPLQALIVVRLSGRV